MSRQKLLWPYNTCQLRPRGCCHEKYEPVRLERLLDYFTSALCARLLRVGMPDYFVPAFAPALRSIRLHCAHLAFRALALIVRRGTLRTSESGQKQLLLAKAEHGFDLNVENIQSES